MTIGDGRWSRRRAPQNHLRSFLSVRGCLARRRNGRSSKLASKVPQGHAGTDLETFEMQRSGRAARDNSELADAVRLCRTRDRRPREPYYIFAVCSSVFFCCTCFEKKRVYRALDFIALHGVDLKSQPERNTICE